MKFLLRQWYLNDVLRVWYHLGGSPGESSSWTLDAALASPAPKTACDDVLFWRDKQQTSRAWDASVTPWEAER